jgi:glycosyltransferase involved in cell wall biosynthesis
MRIYNLIYTPYIILLVFSDLRLKRLCFFYLKLDKLVMGVLWGAFACLILDFDCDIKMHFCVKYLITIGINAKANLFFLNKKCSGKIYKSLQKKGDCIMKKILLIHHCGTISGAGVSLLHIIRAIDKTQYKINVLCPDYPNEMINLLKNEECEFISSKASPKIFAHYNGGIRYMISFKTIKNGLDILKDKKNIKQYIKETDTDIVAVNSMTLFWIGKIAKKMNKSTVCFHRETYQKGLFGIRTKFIKYGLSKWFDKIAFISWNDFNETGDINATKKIIYDRVDIPSFNNYEKQEARQTLGLDQNKKYILYLGGTSALKGSDIIMKAMKYIKNENVNLIFINDTDDVQKTLFNNCKTIKEKIKYVLNIGVKMKTLEPYFKNKLEDKVVFKRRTSNPELYYKACDLVVFPSTQAHQSRPIYEAGLTKIPILITDFKQTKEFAQDGVTAITFKNKNSYDLAQKINMVFENKIDISKIIENNYKQSIKNHDLSTLKQDLDDLFKIND